MACHSLALSSRTENCLSSFLAFLELNFDNHKLVLIYCLAQRFKVEYGISCTILFLFYWTFEACFCTFSKAGIKNEFTIFSVSFFNTGWFSFHKVIFSVSDIKIKGLIQVVDAVFSGSALSKLSSDCYSGPNGVQPEFLSCSLSASFLGKDVIVGKVLLLWLNTQLQLTVHSKIQNYFFLSHCLKQPLLPTEW